MKKNKLKPVHLTGMVWRGKIRELFNEQITSHGLYFRVCLKFAMEGNYLGNTILNKAKNEIR